MHFAAQQSVAKGGVILSRRDAIAPALRRKESRGRHAEWSEQASIEEFIQPLAGDRFNRLRERDRAEVRVDERVARLAQEGRGVDQRQSLVACLGFGVRWAPGRHPGGMCEQVPNGHGWVQASAPW